MGKQAGKTQDKSHTTAGTSAKQQVSSGGALPYVNNRPENSLQGSMQTAATSSSQVVQLAGFFDWFGRRQAMTVPPPRDRVANRGGSRLPDQALVDTTFFTRKRQRETPAKTRREKLNYLFLGGASSAAGAARAKTMNLPIPYIPSEAIISSAASGAVGAAGDLIETGYSARDAADSSYDGDSRVQYAGESIGSFGSAVRSGATSMLNFSDYFHAGLNTGATQVAAGASILSGSADVFTGVYGALTAHDRQKRLDRLQTSATASNDHKLAAKVGSASQGREKIRNIAKVFKGAASVVGGALLLTAASTPLGWMVLGGAAGIALVGTAINYIKKRRDRDEMAASILGVKDDWENWKEYVKDVESETGWKSDARDEGMKAAGQNPLKRALKYQKYKDSQHCIDNYVQTVSRSLAADLRNPAGASVDTLNLLRNIGFNTNNPAGITQEKIAKKLLP